MQIAIHNIRQQLEYPYHHQADGLAEIVQALGLENDYTTEDVIELLRDADEKHSDGVHNSYWVERTETASVWLHVGELGYTEFVVGPHDLTLRDVLADWDDLAGYYGSSQDGYAAWGIDEEGEEE